MTTGYQTLFLALEGCVRIADAVSQLPAVATTDWADQAARAFSGLSPVTRVCLMIGTLDVGGGLSNQEAIGVSVQGGGLTDEASQHMELTLRSRAERLISVGFRPTEAALSRGMVSPMARLSEGVEWRQGPLGPLWAGIPAGDLLVGLIRLGGHEPGRSICVQVACGERERFEAEQVGVMRAVLPLLQAKALNAIGPRRATTARWLTSREQQVLRELTLGKSVREIAVEIDRSQHTVHDHVKSLHRKLGATSRGELVARALGHGSADGHDAGTLADPSGVMFLLHEAPAGSVERAKAKPVQQEGKPELKADGRPEVVIPDARRMPIA